MTAEVFENAYDPPGAAVDLYSLTQNLTQLRNHLEFAALVHVSEEEAAAMSRLRRRVLRPTPADPGEPVTSVGGGRRRGRLGAGGAGEAVNPRTAGPKRGNGRRSADFHAARQVARSFLEGGCWDLRRARSTSTRSRCAKASPLAVRLHRRVASTSTGSMSHLPGGPAARARKKSRPNGRGSGSIRRSCPPRAKSQSVVVGLAGPDADDLVQRVDEDLAVADVAGPGGGLDGVIAFSRSSSRTAIFRVTLGTKPTSIRPPR